MTETTQHDWYRFEANIRENRRDQYKHNIYIEGGPASEARH